jgi:hypothetical protein
MISSATRFAWFIGMDGEAGADVAALGERRRSRGRDGHVDVDDLTLRIH